MSEDMKGNLTFLAFVLGIGSVCWALMFWVFNLTWWISLLLGVIGGITGTVFLCVLPLIIWGIVGD